MRDHEAVADARQFRGEIVGDAVGEIVLGRIAGEVGEGQHHHGKRPRRGGRRRARDDGFERGARQKKPRAAARGGGECDDRDGDHQRHRAPLGGRAHGDADLQRIGPNRLFDVLQLGLAEVGDRHVEPPAHLAISVLGKTDASRLGDAFQSRGDVDAVAHQIAVAFLDDVAEVNADAELDRAVGRKPGVALDHAVLHLDGAAHGFDDAAELDDRPVAGAFDHAALMHGDGRIDQIAAQRAQPRQSAILVRAGRTAVADNVGGEYRGDLAGLLHGALSATMFAAASVGCIAAYGRQPRNTAVMNKTNSFLRRGKNVAPLKPGFGSGFGPPLGRVGRAVLEVTTAAEVKVCSPPICDIQPRRQALDHDPLQRNRVAPYQRRR